MLRTSTTVLSMCVLMTNLSVSCQSTGLSPNLGSLPLTLLPQMDLLPQLPPHLQAALLLPPALHQMILFPPPAPLLLQSITEQEVVVKSVEECQSSCSASPSPDTLMWPTIGGMPVNEFTTEGYIACAFPTLFRTGAADFLGQRQIPVTTGNYLKHLMMYEDSRFAIHPCFRFFALNTKMQWRALQTGRVYVKQHHGDAQLSLDELRDMVRRQGETFSSRVLHYASSLRGTKQYWYRQHSRLLAMVDTLGLLITSSKFHQNKELIT